MVVVYESSLREKHVTTIIDPPSPGELGRIRRRLVDAGFTNAEVTTDQSGNAIVSVAFKDGAGKGSIYLRRLMTEDRDRFRRGLSPSDEWAVFAFHERGANIELKATAAGLDELVQPMILFLQAVNRA